MCCVMPTVHRNRAFRLNHIVIEPFCGVPTRGHFIGCSKSFSRQTLTA
uniref:Uncharacterized protein n=1 Tax=Rhizophora mucronata TaxID=61149 RepID=A0A2P2JJQ7_RHIMU